MKNNRLIITTTPGSNVEGAKKSLRVKDYDRAVSITQRIHPSVLHSAVFKNADGDVTQLTIKDKYYYNHGIRILGKTVIN